MALATTLVLLGAGVAAGAAGDLTTSAGLSRPVAVAAGTEGAYVAEAGAGRVTRLADGRQIATGLQSPQGVAVGSDGTVYIADAGAGRVLRVRPDGATTAVDLGQFNRPSGVAVAPDGTVYVAETGANRIRAVAPDGTTVTVADHLASPLGVALGPDGAVYVADTLDNRVVRVVPGGAMETVVGSDPDPCDGPLSPPTGVAVAPDGTLYVADAGNHRVRRVSTAGVITTVAGTGVEGDGPDTGRAISAALRFPTGVAVDGDDLLITDSENGKVRRVDAAAGDPTARGERLAGGDRFATAAAVSARYFPSGAPVAYVATGSTFADALAASGAAGAGGGPVLLAGRDDVPSATRAELDRLKPAKVVVVGGPAAVSDAVVRAVGATRVAGNDRYETAAALSASVFQPGVATAYVATGVAFPDALGAGAAAAAGKVPVLLAGRDEVPTATRTELDRLKPAKVVVVGGPAAVSDEVVSAVGATRVAGNDRYETAAAVSTATASTGTPALVATGATFPDGLAAAAAAGTTRGPVLLVPCGALPDTVATEMKRLRPSALSVVGGPAAVSDNVAVRLGDLLP